MAGPSNDPSVFDEPHMRPGSGKVACWKCGYDRSGLAVTARCPECGAGAFPATDVRAVADQEDAEQAEQSVWEEPTVSPEIAGPPPPDAPTYAAWLAERRRRTPPAATWAATVLLAAAAGPWAIFGVFAAHMMGEGASASGGSMVGLLGVLLIGPLMEEVMKVAAATYVVERRPYLFSSAGQVALCCLAGGLAFAAVENVLYLQVYIRNPSPEVRVWRWTVCVCMHCACSLIAGLGLMTEWRRTVSTGQRPNLDRAAGSLSAAIVVHSLYNLMAVWLEWSGRL